MVADPRFIRGPGNEIASPYCYVVTLTGTLASIVLYTYYICEVGIPAIIIPISYLISITELCRSGMVTSQQLNYLTSKGRNFRFKERI